MVGTLSLCPHPTDRELICFARNREARLRQTNMISPLAALWIASLRSQ
jgi:hypothetical protein